MNEQELQNLIDEHRRIITKEQDIIFDLEQKLLVFTVKEMRQDIGKCFKSKNCGPVPDAETDYWYRYERIFDVDENGDYRIIYFEQPSNPWFGRTIGDRTTHYIEPDMEEISREEYKVAKDVFLKQAQEDLEERGAKL